MAPLKSPANANFKSRHFSFLVPIDLSSSSKSIVAKTSILLPPSLQDGSSKSLFIVGASSLGTTIGAEELISFGSNPIVPKPKKAKEAKWELNRVFQDIWVGKLYWLEAMMASNGKLSIVKCEVCNSIEKRDKSFVSKFDGLHKHVGRRKVIVAKPDVKVGKYFTSLNNQHAKNE
jgi:hypothetical protein